MTEQGVYYQLRDFPSLVEAGRRGIALNPNEWVEHQSLGTGYEGTGRLTEAIAEYQKAVELSNGDQDANASLAHAFAVTGRRAEAEKILQRPRGPIERQPCFALYPGNHLRGTRRKR